MTIISGQREHLICVYQFLPFSCGRYTNLFSYSLADVHLGTLLLLFIKTIDQWFHDPKET